MTDFYKKIVEWYDEGGGCGYIIACQTSTEFDNYKKDILTYLENHFGANIEAIFSILPPLTEDQVNHLVEATNNARFYH